MNKTQIKYSFLLLLAAAIWGSAFVAQSMGMNYVQPFTFTCIRSIIGGTVLLFCILLLEKWKKGFATKTEWFGGFCCGILLFMASNFQQFGISYTTVGKAGFITTLYVVIVPILGLFMKKRVSILIWGCVGLSVLGLYLLCLPAGGFVLAFGDILVFFCAILFSFHILAIDYFSPRGDAVVISCIQFFVCGVFSGIAMLLTESPSMSNILDAKWSILYAGVLSSGIAFTLQVVAQKHVNPTVASLIMCLESVVAVLAGWIVLGQGLTTREVWGCVLMFLAIVFAQLPVPNKKKERI